MTAQGPDLKSNPFGDALKAAAADLRLDPALIDRLEQRLRELVGGTTLYIPAPDRRPRDAAIRAASRSGQLPRELAVQFRLSENRIRQILRQGDRHD